MAIFDSRKYAVTLKLIFLKAVYEIFPDIEVEIEHSLNNGTYGTVTKGEKITEEGIKKIDKKMKAKGRYNYKKTKTKERYKNITW